MKMIGFTKDDEQSIFKIVSAVLWMGNCAFEGGETSQVKDKTALANVARLLQVDEAALGNSLTSRSITAGGGAKPIIKALTAAEATDARDALAKALYERLFKWLVRRINENIQYQSESGTEEVMSSIGVLDIYGFEILKNNSFEQFSINFCNEKLQQLFIELTLKKEQEEYVREGIVWTPVEYFNNQKICELMETKQGIYAYMDEENSLPTGTDETFLEKIKTAFKGHDHFLIQPSGGKNAFPPNSFLLKHYAGDVYYSVEGMLNKNKDQLFKLHQECLSASKSRAVRSMFPPVDARSTKRPPSAGYQFKQQVNELMNTLLTCEPHYIRTIKSNSKKSAGLFETDLVKHQARYLGLLENIRVRRAGFCYRKEYATFLERYKIVTKDTWPNYRGAAADGCDVILKSIGCDEAEFQRGKTKMFIKNPQTVFALDKKRDEMIPGQVVKIQSVYRGHAVRSKIAKLRAALLIQRVFKRYRRRKHLREITPEQRREAQKRELLRKMFAGKKQGWEDKREWKGNYIASIDDSQLPTLCAAFPNAKDKTIIFATPCKRLMGNNKWGDRALIITDKSIYYADPSKFVPKKRIDLKNLQTLFMSNKSDSFFVFRDSQSYDWVFNHQYKTEMAYVLMRQCKKTNKKELHMEFLKDSFKQKTRTGHRTLVFEHGPQLMDKARGKTEWIVTSPKVAEEPLGPAIALGKVTKDEGPRVIPPKKYKALFDYDPQEDDEMALQEGQMIEVPPSERAEGGWIKGQNLTTKKIGLFPLNYVQQV
eukprot:Lithocolla_globosa_v1_NODE_646_length_3525_cov_40.886455.p1 type:complete len:767 gc:universal NODE_646_length_3525_cov_40.886455:2395-95(-)